MVELKEEDIIGHTATATQLSTPATGDHSRTLSELHHCNYGKSVLLCTHSQYVVMTMTY